MPIFLMKLVIIYVCIQKILIENISVICEDGSIDIDMDHFLLERDCGKFPSIASSRISNAHDSNQHYPWVVKVMRSNAYLENKDQGHCGGSVITKNIAITAAHCLCGALTKKDYAAEKHIRDKIDCRGGQGKIKDKNNLPNEVTNDNTIKVGAGEKNHRKLIDFQILYAYIHDTYEDVFKSGMDIGLVKTYENKGDNIHGKTVFYDDLIGDFKIGPICLVAENADLSKDIFQTVGWGVRYGEIKKEKSKISETTSEQTSVTSNLKNPDVNLPEDPIENKHSCTTNSEGPIDQTFKHCDVAYLKTQNWNCGMNIKPLRMINFYLYLTRKLQMTARQTEIYTNNYRINEQGKYIYYPPGYNAEECIKLWNKADMAMRLLGNLLDLNKVWINTKQIEVGRTQKPNYQNLRFDHRDFTRIKTCFKDEIFVEHGWCFTQGEIESKEWGFCDSSCKIMPYREQPERLSRESLPDVYQKSYWKANNAKPDDDCLENDDVRKGSPGIMCIQSSLPTVTISYFHMKDDNTLKYLGNVKRKEKDYPSRVKWGFQQICYGDSGGGHWTLDSKVKRATLVGISTQVSEDWCGSTSIIDKLNYPSIHSWIKQHAQIK